MAQQLLLSVAFQDALFEWVIKEESQWVHTGKFMKDHLSIAMLSPFLLLRNVLCHCGTLPARMPSPVVTPWVSRIMSQNKPLSFMCGWTEAFQHGNEKATNKKSNIEAPVGLVHKGRASWASSEKWSASHSSLTGYKVWLFLFSSLSFFSFYKDKKGTNFMHSIDIVLRAKWYILPHPTPFLT